MDLLYDAAPYIGRFQNSVFVIKIGGEILLSPERLLALGRQLHVLWQIGIHPVVVHGAGPQLDRALKEVDHASTKIDGRRVTDAVTLEHAKRTFRGTANLNLVTALRGQGLPAVGVSGADAGLLLLQKRPPVEIGGNMVDFGYVGDPVKVAPDLLRTLINDRFVPVVCSLGVDATLQILNVNADTMACELAVATNAQKLMFVTNRNGILHDPEDPSSIYGVLDLDQLDGLIQDGTVVGGMIPKANAAASALKRGVQRVHIIGADEPNALLEEVFTNQGCGTMIVTQREKTS